MYLTMEGPVDIPVSADSQIKREVTRINTTMAKHGVSHVNPIDWCLLRILTKIHDKLKVGPAEIDLDEEREQLLSDLSDETTVDWDTHFTQAVSRLEVILAPHADS